MLEAIVFWISAVVAVAAGVTVFRTDSMARATYALAASFVAVGLMLLTFALDYLGVIVILMMVMEMAIMALFMIMLMGMNPALMPMSMVHGKRTAAVVAGLVFVGLATAALLVPWPGAVETPAGDTTRSLGEAVMGSKMLVMLTISPVLFATIVGALVLGHPRDRYQRYGADLAAGRPDDPIDGGVGR